MGKLIIWLVMVASDINCSHMKKSLKCLLNSLFLKNSWCWHCASNLLDILVFEFYRTILPFTFSVIFSMRQWSSTFANQALNDVRDDKHDEIFIQSLPCKVLAFSSDPDNFSHWNKEPYSGLNRWLESG